MASEERKHRGGNFALDNRKPSSSDTLPLMTATIGDTCNVNNWPSSMNDNFRQHFKQGVYKGKLKAKKRKQAAQLGLAPPLSKNAVVALNELRPGLEYRLMEQRGPTHLPTFVMKIEVNGQAFKAEGRTKKQAKHLCAQQALSSFVQFRDASEGTFVNPMGRVAMVRKEICFQYVFLKLYLNLTRYQSRLKLVCNV